VNFVLKLEGEKKKKKKKKKKVLFSGGHECSGISMSMRDIERERVMVKHWQLLALVKAIPQFCGEGGGYKPSPAGEICL